MYNTKLTVEITISTQFGPLDAISVIDTLTRVPAVKSLDVVKLETDYVSPEGFPEDVNLQAIRNIPCKIR